MQAAIASLRETPAYLRARERLLLLSFSPEDPDPDRELDFLLAAAEATRRDERVRLAVARIKQRRNEHGRRLRSPTVKRSRRAASGCRPRSVTRSTTRARCPCLRRLTIHPPPPPRLLGSPARLPQVRHVLGEAVYQRCSYFIISCMYPSCFSLYKWLSSMLPCSQKSKSHSCLLWNFIDWHLILAMHCPWPNWSKQQAT